MADCDVKALTADLECSSFEDTAFVTLRRPLSECSVAVVTTASLHHPDQAGFVGGDTTYRVLDGNR